MSYSDDPISDFNSHDAEQEAWAKRLPVCYGCDEPIYDDALYDIEETLYCERCVNDRFRKWTENYMD